MISALMVWVCICQALAQLNNAGSHRDAHGKLAGQDEFFDGNEQQFEAGPEDRSAPAPVWRFLQGRGKSPGISEFDQPQFRCSNGTLTLRFSPTRYTNLHLEDGTPLLSLPDKCYGSIHIYRWYLLVKLPYTGCYTATQTEEGKYPLKLHYFDNWLQRNMIGMAVCENPAMSPLVTCGTTSITVKLPRETKLKKVKELDYFVYEAYSVRQWKTPNALFVKISKLPDQDSGFELIYFDSTGKLCTKLAICYQKLRHRVNRALEEPDFEDTPVEPFDPAHLMHDTDLMHDTQWIKSMETATKAPNSETVAEDSTELFELWGIEDIPDEPYDGFDVEITTPTAPTITTTNSTKTTIASTTSCP
ncbi:uncharacterized protein LOC116035186 [Sander lucioperca]|uniref:uncharacterized protein LOC116035186 n=1 Tax=Sander lucioperca TaxID=283035 RepID=UPI00125D2224|nr:uncharacterized protein LOC116035186 [Sander lucioperca]